METSERLKLIRRGGDVHRWHNRRTMGVTETVAQHSWGVAILLLHFWPDCSKRLLTACLYHDVAEVRTGDMPADTKWDQDGNLAQALAAAERRVEEELGVSSSLHHTETLWLKVLDKLDLLLFCLDQQHGGSRHLNTPFNRVSDWMEEREAMVEAISPELWSYIVSIIKLGDTRHD
jgi:5'-deoxynucleotidase YfbR-like HD superfamily hydrolase